MKRHGIGFATLQALAFAWSSTGLAHEECHDDSSEPAATWR